MPRVPVPYYRLTLLRPVWHSVAVENHAVANDGTVAVAFSKISYIL